MSLIECTKDLRCPELETETRKRLYGMKSTKRDFINEIIRLRLGDTRRHQPSLNNSEIADKLAVGRDFVIEMIKLGASHGFCQLEQSGRLKIPEATNDLTAWQRLQDDDFGKHPLIAEWMQIMRNKNDGEGLVNWSDNVQAVRIICNTLKIKPDSLVIDKATTKKYWINFLDALKADKLELDFVNKRKAVSIQSQQKRYKTALRRFCSAFGITWGRGEDDVMGNKVVGHGKYANIRLTDEEFEMADKYLKAKYGTDSDMFRIFWVGVESCARDGALFSMALAWDKITDDDEEIFVMRAFESKTKKYNGGWWEKFITRKETQESLRAHKQRGNALIWTKQRALYEKRFFQNALRELFVAVGKIPNIDELRETSKTKRSTGNYFFDKPTHTLRHIGAHYWLAKTDYDYGIVAEFGGWMTIDELKKSYGAMPPEIKYKKLKAAKHKLTASVAQVMPANDIEVQ